MNITSIIRLGGHIFYSATDCAKYFDIPIPYITHMIESDDYPGCTMEFVVDVDEEMRSYYQTLSIMKAIDNC